MADLPRRLPPTSGERLVVALGAAPGSAAGNTRFARRVPDPVAALTRTAAQRRAFIPGEPLVIYTHPDLSNPYSPGTISDSALSLSERDDGGGTHVGEGYFATPRAVAWSVLQSSGLVVITSRIAVIPSGLHGVGSAARGRLVLTLHWISLGPSLRSTDGDSVNVNGDTVSGTDTSWTSGEFALSTSTPFEVVIAPQSVPPINYGYLVQVTQIGLELS